MYCVMEKGQFNNGGKQESECERKCGLVELIFVQKNEEYVARSRSNKSGNTQYFSLRAFHVCVHLLIFQFKCHDSSCIRSDVAKSSRFASLFIRLIDSECVSARNFANTFRLLCGAAGAVDKSVLEPFITQKNR